MCIYLKELRTNENYSFQNMEKAIRTVRLLVDSVDEALSELYVYGSDIREQEDFFKICFSKGGKL